jgi:competence protein ComEC
MVSSDSTSEKFLAAVDPTIAIISCGLNNEYGHPDKELLDRLEARGITVYRTDRDGTITLLLDGTNVKVIQ